MCSGADKHAYTALWSGGEHSAVTFWGFVHVLVGSKLKLVKWLMRAVSRLQLQMNRTQCPFWPFDFRFYCSSSSSSTYFSGYLLFNLQNNVFLYHFFHFYRFNTPYPPLSDFQEFSRWSQSRLEYLSCLYCHHEPHWISCFQLGMLSLAQNTRSRFFPLIFCLMLTCYVSVVVCTKHILGFFYHMFWP